MMLLLVISAVLASLAMGVTVAYAACWGLFAILRERVRTVRTERPAALQMQANAEI